MNNILSDRKPLFSILNLLIFLALLAPLRAQTVPGQYEDEAPLRTWNSLGPLSASAAGMGGVRYARASDYMAVLVNPALGSRHPRFTLTLDGAFTNPQLHKFAYINTGVLFSEDNLTSAVYALDFAGLSAQYRGWGLSINYSLLEDYSRPVVETETFYQGDLYHRIEFRQDGLLKNLNFSLSRQILPWLSVGLGVNFLNGNYERLSVERFFLTPITLTDEKTHEISGTYFNGGILVTLSEKLSLAAIFRTPCDRKADSRSLIRNQTEVTETDIRIDVTGESRFRQPLALGAGLDWWIGGPFNIAADITYLDWSGYSVDFFGEPLPRRFKDVIRFNAGIEFRSLIKLFGQAFMVPSWLGVCLDPQPMRDPDSSYTYITFGTGIRSRHFYLDLSSMIGTERGSGDDLKARKMSLTLGYAF